MTHHAHHTETAITYARAVILANEARAARGARAVLAYRNYPGICRGETEDHLGDLLTDLLHLADQYGGAETTLARSLAHYREEVGG